MADPRAGAPLWQQPLLPGELQEAPTGRRSVRDWIVDVATWLIAIGIGAAVLGDTWSAHGELAAIVDVVLGVVALVALWWRRSHPVAVGLVGTCLAIVSASAAGAGVFAGFNAAIRAPRRALAGIVAISLAGVFIYPLLYPSEEPGGYAVSVVVGILITAVVVGWGLFVRARRVLVHSLRERAERLEAEQKLRVEQAREAERRRIAGEMHDVLAHRVSLLSLHAGALEFRPDAPPEEVAQAAGVIRATAHAALEELRQVIGVLREDPRPELPERPQPTLAQIPALVEESQAAGTAVRCRVEVGATAEAMPAVLGRTAYRIVQEGLTNARKHAPGARVDVAVVAADGRLVVEVVSRRPVGVPAGAAPAAAGLPGSGSGLIGLAERVALSGGQLEHGADGAGDFVLRATLPWLP